jgi:hypothetical protein
MNDNETEKQITEIFTIKAYIDRKIKEERTEMVDKITEACKSGVNNYIANLIHYGNDGIDRDQLPRELTQKISGVIRQCFRNELGEVNQRHRRAKNFEKEVVDNAEQIVKDYVDSEEFIDTIVTRIKNKQL